MPAWLLIAAAIGTVRLWDRAAPLQRLRAKIIVSLHRRDEATNIRPYHAVLWWLKGVLGCDECLSPYVGFAFGLIDGHGILIGLATYAVYTFVKPRSAT